LVPTVIVLTVYNDELIAGGAFTTAGGNPASSIARWQDCDTCLADITNDDQVNVDDLLDIMASWGPCPPQLPPCPPDILPWGGDGIVDIEDLEAVILGWGPCSPGWCAQDVDHDGTANLNDLLWVLEGWGECPPPEPPVCQANITNDWEVNVDDLLMVIAAWGPCR
jgi:hypothetical protein